MNIEKFNSLAYAIVEENKKLQYLRKFKDLLNTLQYVISDTKQLQHQIQLSNDLENLKSVLKISLVNDLSPAFYHVLVDLKIDDIIGNNLSKKIDSIFSSNQITPVKAKQELEIIFNKLDDKINAFKNVVSGLQTLEINYDELEEGECEIGILIPRRYLKNDLRNLSNEINEFTLIVNYYAELITGHKESLQIRTLSTSEPLITIATATVVAAGISKTIGWLISNYKKLIEIKKLKSELKKQGLSKNDLQGISEYSNDFMKKTIEEIVKNLAKEYNGNTNIERKNELLNEIRISLNKIANRIDRGFNFEIRIKPITNTSKNDLSKENQIIIDEIIKASKLLQFIKFSEQPILSLPEEK